MTNFYQFKGANTLKKNIFEIKVSRPNLKYIFFNFYNQIS